VDGAAGAPAGSVLTSSPSRIERARVRRCVGEPARQIEDPQSPPCVPFWEGDNGGDTSFGIAGNEIRVVMPALPEVQQQLEQFFNRRFEFYGRRLKLIPIVTGSLCQHLKDGADRVEKDVKAFASLSLFKSENCYMAALAQRKIIGISIESVFTHAELRSLHPYVWAYPMSNDDLLEGMGQWACARLVGGNARFADGVGLDGRPMALSPRKFGVLIQPHAEGWPVDLTPLESELARCGGTIAAEREMRTPDANEATASVLAMKSASINSIFCLCGSWMNLYLPSAASSQQYFPEWLVSSYALSDSNINLKTFWADAQQRANLLGIGVQPRQWRFEDTPLIWALREEDPDWESRNSGASSVAIQQFNRLYRMLLLLSSGIQAAGPHLTPETFARALQTTAFPNPATPLLAGGVGLDEPDHSMTRDFVEYYWSEAAPSPFGDGPGSLCWVDGGARRDFGSWPRSDDAFFGLDCDTGNRPPA
jgi:hypothetical protein